MHHESPTTGYSQRLAALDTLLWQTRMLWQVKAFECHHLPWEGDFPNLADAVWAIADNQIDVLDSAPLQLFAALVPALQQDLTALQSAEAVDITTRQTWLWDLTLLQRVMASRNAPKDSSVTAPISTQLLSQDDEAHFSAHIKGRKWQQIAAFVAAILDDELSDDRDAPSGTRKAQPSEQRHYLEWCAGKGHLGRLIAKARGADVLSLEWQAQLCEQGQAFANKWKLKQKFICADAFNDTVTPLFINMDNTASQHAVALHACGDLHVRLLQLGVAAQTDKISISPCCYHLIRDTHYQPLSAIAKASALTLSRHDLQLPLQHSVIANPKQQGLRHQEIAWRLGFDTLQRQCRGVDCYLPIPSIKQSQLSGSFSEFCQWAAQCKAVVLPPSLRGKNGDFGAYLAIGRQRQRLTQRIDLVAHLFREALEQWLLLDRVCFLEAQGYQVSLSEFCPTSITPRNALIRAIRASV